MTTTGKPSSEGAAAVGACRAGEDNLHGTNLGAGRLGRSRVAAGEPDVSALVPPPVELLIGTLMWFLLGYFGWSDHRTEHQLVPSLLRAVFGGMFFGLWTTVWFEWMDRPAERE